MTYDADDLIRRMRNDPDSDWPTRLINALAKAPLVERIPAHPHWPGADVTTQERSVLAAAAAGMTASMTAEVLGIGVQTVMSHRAAVIYKTGAKNITHAVALAFRTGVIA